MTGKNLLKTCIVGVGAIGGWIGAGLARAGCDVSVVARGEALANIRAHGLRLQTVAGVEAAYVRSSDDPAALGVQDLVVVAVKAPAQRPGL